MARGNDRPALRIVRDDGSDRSFSFAELSRRSNQVANALRVARRPSRRPTAAHAAERRADVGDDPRLHEARRRRVPATPQLTPLDLADRFERGAVRHVVTDGDGALKFATLPGDYTRLIVGVGSAGMDAIRDARTRCLTRSSRTATPTASDPTASLLHLGHDGEAEARAAHARELSGRASVHDVLDRPARGRRALEHQLAGLGQARVEQRLRAVERGRDDLRLRLPALRREARARHDRALRRDDALRAAHRLADADRRESRRRIAWRCARSRAPASRSTPRSSSACSTPGA